MLVHARSFYIASVFLAACAVIFISAPAALAAGPWKGDAFVSQDNAGLGTRNFALRTVNDQNAAQDRGSWELDAGDSLTLYFKTWTTGVPPDAATNIILRVYSDNGNTQIIQLHNGAPPADGTTFTFYSTDNGLNTGTPVAGTYRLYVQAQCVGALNCPLGTYDINSDTDGDKGALRGGIKVSDITKNAYPAGSTYAYGPAGDETMTFTAVTTDRFEDTGTGQTVRVNTKRNAGSVIETGTTQELGSGGSTSNGFVADNTYDPTGGTDYDVQFEIVGTSALLTGEKWTHIATAGNGASITRDGATIARYANRFVVDPRIYFSIDGASATNDATSTYAIYNRAETVTSTFQLLNARNEALSRSMNVSVLNSVGSVESGPTSKTPSSNVYTFTYSVGTSDTATNDTTGSSKKLRVTNTDQTKDSNNVFAVSSLYFVDAHPQLNDTSVNKDDFPTEDANETTSGVISADIFSFFAHVKNVRKDTNIDTSGSAVTFTVTKPDNSTRTTQTSDTGSDGWTSNFDFALEAPGGAWAVTASTTFNGNSGTDSETLTFVSPYAGNYAIYAVGWNQTYDIGETARFTIQTTERQEDGTFDSLVPDSAPTYQLRYWDGSAWQNLASGSMSALAETATYEITYAIPSDSSWIGRKIAVSFSAVVSGTQINEAREIEIVGSPARIIINSMSDTTIPTISASVRITNEGTAAFEYTYEWCIVTSVSNECGGGDDVTYASAAKFIQAGTNFDTTLTLTLTQTGSYYFKAAVWWSNQSSKASQMFTATEAGAAAEEEEPAATTGGGGLGAPVPTATPVATAPPPPPVIDIAARFSEVWQKIGEILLRLLGLEERVARLEIRVTALEEEPPCPPTPCPVSVPAQAPVRIREPVAAPKPKPRVFIRFH